MDLKYIFILGGIALFLLGIVIFLIRVSRSKTLDEVMFTNDGEADGELPLETDEILQEDFEIAEKEKSDSYDENNPEGKVSETFDLSQERELTWEICPDCGGLAPEGASKCPMCGCVLKEQTKTQPQFRNNRR